MVKTPLIHRRISQLNKWPKRLITNLQVHEEINGSAAVSLDCPRGHFCIGLTSDDKIRLNNQIYTPELDQKLYLRGLETL